MQQTYQKEVSFFDWLLIGGPFTLIFLPIAWLLITRVLFRADIGEIAGGRKHFNDEYRKLGRSEPRREGRVGRLFRRPPCSGSAARCSKPLSSPA